MSQQDNINVSGLSLPVWAMQSTAQQIDDATQRVIATPGAGAITYEDVGAAPAPLSSAVTLYVNGTSGNDNNSGTQDEPFATIQAAINSIPKTLNNCSVTINVAPGNYNENVVISGFSGGNYSGLILIGSSNQISTGVEINSLQIFGCSAIINVNGFYISGAVFSESVVVSSSVSTTLSYLNVDQNVSSIIGIDVGRDGTSTVVINQCNVSNATRFGIVSTNGSICAVRAGLISNCAVGIAAGSNSNGMPGIVMGGAIKPTFNGNTANTAVYYGSQMWGIE